MDYEKAYKEVLEKAKKELATCGSMNCDAARQIFRFFPELAESEDERIIKTLQDYVKNRNWALNGPTHNEVLAWLEKQKEQNLIMANSPQLKEQKPAEWSEEDEDKLNHILEIVHIASGREVSVDEKEELESFLKSLRPQSKDEIYKRTDEAYKLGKHHLAVKFMNYLDDNRPEGKMGLSNNECESIDKAFKENDWTTIMRYVDKYRPSWKPSEEQINAIVEALKYLPNNKDEWMILDTLMDELMKLM